MQKLSRETAALLKGAGLTLSRLNLLIERMDGERGLIASVQRTSDSLGDVTGPGLSDNLSDTARELRLGRIESWSHLRERMVVRRSAQELIYQDGRRWTERPDVYLRRALSLALFERRGLAEVRLGRAITLEVELTAFEEVQHPPEAEERVRLQAFYSLHDERLGLLQDTGQDVLHGSTKVEWVDGQDRGECDLDSKHRPCHAPCGLAPFST